MEKTLNLDIGNKDALIIADVQKDFLPGGALSVAEGDQIIPVLNEYIKIFEKANAKIIAARDWHPPNHISFTTHGGPWPPHCVQDTNGASFSPDLKLPDSAIIVSKATDPKKEAYSVFDGTGLSERLKSEQVTRVFIGGLATDYCVVSSVVDARKLGFVASVLADAVRGINVNLGDVEKAFTTMRQQGAFQLTLASFPDPTSLSGDENHVDVDGDKPIAKQYFKKKARMRPRGYYKQVRRERG